MVGRKSVNIDLKWTAVLLTLRTTGVETFGGKYVAGKYYHFIIITMF